MAAPLDRGPSPGHTHERMIRLYNIVIEMDKIEMRIEEIDAKATLHATQAARQSVKTYTYRCPDCEATIELHTLLNPRHQFICPTCYKIVLLKVILLHHHQESAPDESPPKPDDVEEP